ncbi:HAD family hydrolase [Microscilla marina]|uniref:Development protein n=1 Tax=Microscilla marina ATCC 23134 TaxID=313606 RepID=A1ZCM3_MICM2|nr:HAD family hydrolase [Microscilla marina]EAY32025.1 development protein [Microscilla marina ATCC 23134]
MSKTLLILDLDETLIYTSKTPLINIEPAFTLSAYHYVYKRPYLEEFLYACQQYFELAVWSSAQRNYVNPVVKRVFPQSIPLSFVWSRKRCTFGNLPLHYSLDNHQALGSSQKPSCWFKKLEKVRKRGYSLRKILIVDNSPEKVFFNSANAIYINDFQGDVNDVELMLLKKYLYTLHHVENVQMIEKKDWRNSIST